MGHYLSCATAPKPHNLPINLSSFTQNTIRSSSQLLYLKNRKILSQERCLGSKGTVMKEGDYHQQFQELTQKSNFLCMIARKKTEKQIA